MAIPASPAQRFDFEFEQEPYSYAAERALSEKERSVEELEAAVKETPPRSSLQMSRNPYGHESSPEPRSLGDVMDEKMLPPGSPGLRHKKGRLEEQGKSTPQGESKHTSFSSPPVTPCKGSLPPKENGKPLGRENYASVVKHEASDSKSIPTQQSSDRNDTSTNASIVEKEEARLAAVIQQRNSGSNEIDSVEALHEKTNGVGTASQREVAVPSPRKSNGHVEKHAETVTHKPANEVNHSREKSDAGESLIKVKSEEDFADTATVVSDGDNSHGKNDASSRSKDATNQKQSQHAKPAEAQDFRPLTPGALVYENYESRSGTNLASIVLDPEFDMALELAEKEKKSPSDKPANGEPVKRSGLVSGRRAGAGWSKSLVRWAPLNVPLQRRLQTMAVLAHSLSIAGLLAFFFVLCAIPIFWPILLPYLIYVLLSRAPTNGKLTHRSEWIRRSKFWSLFASYFPARLHRTVELEATRKYIFGYHPHGIISHGAFAAFTTEALGFGHLFPGITNTLLTLDTNFRVPLYRDWALRLGLASVSRESCENLLSKGGPNGEGMGRAITIVIGGARESLDAKPGTLNLVLKRRKGFVKLAVRMGADLVPVLAFGENDMYEQIDSEKHPFIHRGQMMLKKFMGFTVPLFHARGLFNYDMGIFPYRRPINIVVGRPIKVVQSKKPDPDYVDKLHQQYTDQLLHIWEEWKDTFAPDRKCELQIIE